MSGQVPPSSRAGKRAASRSQIGRATNLVERFTGHNPEVIGKALLPSSPPDAVAVIGMCDAICYTTVRDGKKESYIHEFERAADKPMFCIAPDGRQILLIGGRYVFTDRGLVDLSDRANLPAHLRR